MNEFAIAAGATFCRPVSFWCRSVLARWPQLFGFYTIVAERQCKVYVLFGKVIGQLDEPGLHLLFPKLGLRA